MNKELSQEIVFEEGSCLFTLGNLTDSITLKDVKTEIVTGNSCAYRYQRVELLYTSDKFEIKKEFRIYPHNPMIACDFFVRKKGLDIPYYFNTEEPELLKLQVQGRHWKLKSVEFFDRTDSNNILVKERKVITYRNQSNRLIGNILYAKDLLKKTTFIILKEAPCSFVQLHYLGYDFYNRGREISVKGTGILPEDITADNWTKTYSIVFGVASDNELEILTTLRT